MRDFNIYDGTFGTFLGVVRAGNLTEARRYAKEMLPNQKKLRVTAA